MEEPDEDEIDENEGGKKKKDKKLVFLSRSVLEKIIEYMITVFFYNIHGIKHI